MEARLDEILRILRHDSYPEWPLRCSLSTNEIARIYELVSELRSNKWKQV